jgi:hypothetical protein
MRSRNMAAFSYSSASEASAICRFSCRRTVDRLERRNLSKSVVIFLYSGLSILAPQGAAHFL